MGQLFYLLRHRGREHNGLTSLGKQFGNREDIIRESHVEHAVSLVEHKETDVAQIHVSHRDMADEASGSCNNDISSHLHGLILLIVAITVVAPVNSHRTHLGHIIGKALHGLVNLLCEFACRTHDDTVDFILRIASIVEHG